MSSFGRIGIINLDDQKELLKIGIDLPELHDQLKRYRDDFYPEVNVLKTGNYQSGYNDFCYRAMIRDSDCSLTCMVFIAKDGYPFSLLQPVIYDTEQFSGDSILLTKSHEMATKTISPHISHLSTYQRYTAMVELLRKATLLG